MIDQGVLGWHQLRELADNGKIRPSLVDEVRRMPHLNGFDEGVAHAFAESDDKAGFKH